MLPYFKNYYKAAIIKRTWYWHHDRRIRSVDQNRVSRNKLVYVCMYIYGQVTFEKGRAVEKDCLFNK